MLVIPYFPLFLGSTESRGIKLVHLATNKMYLTTFSAPLNILYLINTQLQKGELSFVCHFDELRQVLVVRNKGVQNERGLHD